MVWKAIGLSQRDTSCAKAWASSSIWTRHIACSSLMVKSVNNDLAIQSYNTALNSSAANILFKRF